MPSMSSRPISCSVCSSIPPPWPLPLSSSSRPSRLAAGGGGRGPAGHRPRPPATGRVLGTLGRARVDPELLEQRSPARLGDLVPIPPDVVIGGGNTAIRAKALKHRRGRAHTGAADAAGTTPGRGGRGGGGP